MRRTFVSRTRPFSGALVLMLGLTFSGPPAAASETITATPAKPTLSAATRAKLATLTVPARAMAQATPPSEAGSDAKAFFKSKAGIAALALMAAGTGYMVYSAFHDNNPVHSPLR